MTRTLLATTLPESGLNIVVVPASAPQDATTLCVGRFDTPVGPVIVIGAEGILWALGFIDDMTENEVRRDLTRRWPKARFVEAPEALGAAVAALITGSGELRIHLEGTEFQVRVWRALLQIPFGQVTSYGDLAREIGQPGAARAVGTAVGQNPVSWAVPCHRVTRKAGVMGGYHWGEAVKRVLLTREGAILAPRAIARF